MIVRKILVLGIFLLFAFQSLCATSLREQFKQAGYIEICDNKHGTATFDSLYAYFDEFIAFLQNNPVWAQKIYIAKERFIRSKERNYYSTDFFGFYDESPRKGRSQISFYYSTHFHAFICSHYPQFKQVPEIIHFFEACFEIQKPYGNAQICIKNRFQIFKVRAISRWVEGIEIERFKTGDCILLSYALLIPRIIPKIVNEPHKNRVVEFNSKTEISIAINKKRLFLQPLLFRNTLRQCC